MISRFKVFALTFLAVVMIFSLASPSLSSAKEENALQVKVKTEDGHEIGLGTPKTKQNKKELKSQKEKNSKNNSVEQNITIDPLIAESTIEIPLELPDGYTVVLGEDEQGKTDGAAIIYNENNESVALFSSPVSKDKKLKVTSAKVTEDTTIELELDTNGQLVESSDLLVTLAATSFYSYFSSGSWITRDGVRSLSLYHKDYLFSGTTNDRAFKLGDSWNKITAKYSSSSYWYNTSGLNDQYNCHYGTIGQAKNPWNIEPARDDVSYATTLLYACNPPL